MSESTQTALEKAQRLVGIDGDIEGALKQREALSARVEALRAEKAELQRDPDVIALRKALGGRNRWTKSA